MAEKKYFWLKLQEDFFGDKVIKKLRRLAGGDTYTVIFLKMCLVSLKNEGQLIYEGIEDTFAEELASEIEEDVENVSVVLAFMERYGKIVPMSDNELVVPYVLKNIGSESESAERVRKFREKEKEKQKALQCNGDVTECNNEVTVCNVDVTQRKRREREEKEIEKEIEIDYNGIKDAYNTLCPSLQSVKILSDARKKLIKARLKTYSVEQIHEVFRKAEASDFMTNRNDSGWKATFDWIMKDSNFVKVLDGNYDNRNSNKQPYVDNSDKLRDIFE